MRKYSNSLLTLCLVWLLGSGLPHSVAQQLPPAQRIALDLTQVHQQLTPVASRARAGQPATYRLQLPTPQGAQPFELTETFVLPASDPAARQRLRTFVGYQASDPTRHVALTLTARALTAQLLRGPEQLVLHPAPDGRAYLLEPAAAAPSGPCGTGGGAEPVPGPVQHRGANASSLPAPGSFGTQLRTVRMAILVTAEFYAANKGTDGKDNQNVEAAVATIMNGMTLFYQQELSVSFTLVKPTGGNYYFSAMATATLPKSDPATPGRVRNSTPADVRDVIQTRFDPNAYDLGHGLHNTGGGVAFEPAICTDNKGGGWSGASPSGRFQQVLAHEIGHQFGAGHAFNGPCGSNEVGSNLEPGGGASVMGYPYVCNVQNLLLGPTDEDHFSLRSLDKMRTQLLSASCVAAALDTGPRPNRVPAVDAGSDYVIPTQTPFTLTALGNDPDGDALTYTWDQFDYSANLNALGTIAGTGGLAAIDDPESPLFRPRPPRTANARTFPDLAYILANSNQPDDRVGEALSRVGRDIHFGVTVRDNAAGGGAWASDNVTVTVAPNTGPFAVTTQNTASLWVAGQQATVTWSVNGTDQAPIGVSQVRITLSTDGGQTFPTVLAASTPNDGSQTIAIPNLTTSQARLRVEAVGNIFFDINDVDFPIAPCAPVASQILPATALSAPAGDAALNLTENAYGFTELTGANQIQGTITATDPTTFLTKLSGGTCTRYSNVSYYDSYAFVPSATDTYTINTPTGFGYLIIRVYSQNGFVPSDPCQNLLATNYVVSASPPRSLTANLTAGQRYTLVLSNFGTSPPAAPSAPSPGNYSVTFTASSAGGTVYAPLASTGYDYQYAVVNTATNTVVQLAPTADLRTLPAGTYDVRGLLFQQGYEVSGLRNGSLSHLQAMLNSITPCGQLSNNARRVTIMGTSRPLAARDAASPPGFSAQVFPNPVPAGAALQFQVQTRDAQSVHLLLTDAIGRTVWRHAQALPAGTTPVTVPHLGLRQGLYVLTVQPAAGAPVQLKVLF